jgi:DNA repair protein RadC
MRYQRAARPLKLDGPDAARIFFAGCFAESDPARECLWIAHVDGNFNCLHLAWHEGSKGEAPFPLRSIIVDAAHYGSTGLLLAHNHPSGDHRPSRSDCVATRQLSAAAKVLDCTVLDHFVFGSGEISSLREMGLV